MTQKQIKNNVIKDDTNINLELYKILNEHVQKEIEKMYDLHRMYFLTITTLITIAGFAYENN